MVKEGPEVARALVRRTEYLRVILMWDHHGSGWHNRTPEQALTLIQRRLDGVTWTDRSAAIVVVPELEEWLWHCPTGVARCLGSEAGKAEEAISHEVDRLQLPRERCYRERPKELFEAVFYQIRRRKPLPADFDTLGSHANLADWGTSPTFHRFVEALRVWFPPG